MTHLKRAGVLLAAVLFIVFIGLRIIPVPDFLRAYGFHAVDKTASEQQWAAQPMQYVNTSLCNDCHKNQYQTWAKGDHKTVSCENCHGPAKPHLESGADLTVQKSRDLCGLCHSKLTSRPANFPQVDLQTHGNNTECVTCHSPHDPRAGLPPQVPHSLDGRDDCQTCHNPHEPIVTPPPQVPHSLEGRTNCVSCHAQPKSATPPAIPHSLDGRSNCLLCHNTSAIKPFPQSHTGRTSETCQGCHVRK